MLFMHLAKSLISATSSDYTMRLFYFLFSVGNTANHCIVVAQLYTKGQCHGTHPFIVPIRDLDTHEPLPGVKVGDVGIRMGFNTADNGFLRFNQYRIPRENMMMKNAKVLKVDEHFFVVNNLTNKIPTH